MAELHAEYYYRVYHEWLDTIERGGFVFFDTLTYSDLFLPHLSDTLDCLENTPFDYPCFNHEDFRLFMVRLRKFLGKQYDIKDTFRYFYCSEYGTSDYYDYNGVQRFATHRPHYHVLFFVTTPNLDVYTVSKAIRKCWPFGRVDQVRTSGERSNYFCKRCQRSELAVSNYVAKYVQKVSKFQREIDKRIDLALRYMFSQRFEIVYVTKTHENIDAPIDLLTRYRFTHWRHADEIRVVLDEDAYISYSNSEHGKKLKRDVMRLVNQYHRQSEGFGLAALNSIDIIDLMSTGFVTLPDCNNVIKKLPLPKYFERKLFEELVEYNGMKVWQPTSLGLMYRRKKDFRVLRHLSEKFRCLSDDYNYRHDVDFLALARYCVYERGRINGNCSGSVTFKDKTRLPNLFTNYVCSADKALLHGAFVSTSGFDGVRAEYSSTSGLLPIKVFIQKYVYFNRHYEEILHHYSTLQLAVNRQKQSAFDEKQRLKNLQKKEHYQICLSFD